MKNKLLIIILLFTANIVFAQADGDRILAIVGNEIITQSDLNTQLILYARENNIQPTDRIASLILDNMINETLILAKAEQDSITVTEDELNKQVEFRYQQIISSIGSEKNLKSVYGYNVAEIKEILRKDYRRRMIIDKLKQQKFGSGLNISRSEVLDYYNRFKDSIPSVPDEFELLAIARRPEIPQEEKAIAYQRAKEILDSIKAGGDFSAFARKYSQDSVSALNGGNLGKVKKGNFVKEFEEVAFTLKKGEISNIVETQFGYHIIKLNDKIGDIIDVSHILIRIPIPASADAETIRFLKDLKSNIFTVEDFKKAASKYSNDPVTVKDSGYVGKLNLAQLDSVQILALKDLTTGGITEPFKYGDDREYYYVIFYIIDRTYEHKPSIENDYQFIEMNARAYKENSLLVDWYNELKKSIYISKKVNL